MTVKIVRTEGDTFRAESDGYVVVSGRLNEQTPPVGMSPGKLMVAPMKSGMKSLEAAWKNSLNSAAVPIGSSLPRK